MLKGAGAAVGGMLAGQAVDETESRGDVLSLRAAAMEAAIRLKRPYVAAVMCPAFSKLLLNAVLNAERPV